MHTTARPLPAPLHAPNRSARAFACLFALLGVARALACVKTRHCTRLRPYVRFAPLCSAQVARAQNAAASALRQSAAHLATQQAQHVHVSESISEALEAQVLLPPSPRTRARHARHACRMLMLGHCTRRLDSHAHACSSPSTTPRASDIGHARVARRVCSHAPPPLTQTLQAAQHAHVVAEGAAREAETHRQLAEAIADAESRLVASERKAAAGMPLITRLKPSTDQPLAQVAATHTTRPCPTSPLRQSVWRRSGRRPMRSPRRRSGSG